jgi:hypothetical protein
VVGGENGAKQQACIERRSRYADAGEGEGEESLGLSACRLWTEIVERVA